MVPMPGSYSPNLAMFRELAVGPEIRAALLAVAEEAKGIAESLSQEFRVTGEYAASFRVSDETITWHGEHPGPRAAARVTNTAEYAAAVEWGNEHDHRKHRVLGRTLGTLGGRR